MPASETHSHSHRMGRATTVLYSAKIRKAQRLVGGFRLLTRSQLEFLHAIM
jgi:hypothetical protein